MKFVDLEKTIFYKITIYLDIEDLKVLEKTSKKFKKKIRNNPHIENRLLRYNYNVAKSQLRTLKENPFISCIDFLEEKKIENGNVVDRFDNKQKLYEYVKNKFYFQNYRFESLYDTQFRIFENKLRKTKIKKDSNAEKPLLLFKQENKKIEKIKEINKDTKFSIKEVNEMGKKYMPLVKDQLAYYEDYAILYEVQVLMNIEKNLKKVKKKIKERGKKFCPFLIVKNLIKKD